MESTIIEEQLIQQYLVMLLGFLWPSFILFGCSPMVVVMSLWLQCFVVIHLVAILGLIGQRFLDNSEEFLDSRRFISLHSRYFNR